MIKRICSTLVLWTVLISVVYFFKAKGFSVLMMVLALLAGYEACKLLERCSAKPSFGIYALASIILFGVVTFGGFIPDAALGVTVCMLLACFALWVLKHPYSDFPLKTEASTDLLFMFLPVLLCCYSVIAINFTDHLSFRVLDAAIKINLPYAGVILAVWVIAAAKFSDVGGYLFGMMFGKHKMSPTISPKKTWEGAIGGLILSSAISAAIAWGFREQTPEFFSPLFAAVAALPIAILAILSDLLESVLKRRADIKDSGNSIPGIGGALDLADSMVLPVPLAYIILIFAA
jgi:phosphatidate cytidylyltransferase